jgi:ABC-type glycerol-3-phosphate transport system permease component
MSSHVHVPRSGHAARVAGRLVLTAVVIAVVVIVFFLPYVWIVTSSFKSQGGIFTDVSPLSWRTFIPVEPTFDAYRTLFGQKGIGRPFVNSLIVSTLQVLLTVILCSMAAYALTRIKFRGRELIFGLILLTFILPVEALVVPLYQVVSDVGLQDTLAGAFVPFIASPFGLFLLRQAFQEIPRELDEAAILDGAGHFRIFFSVILPNVRTALATLALVTFLFSWNAFLWPLVVEKSPENTMLQTAIAQSGSPGELPNWAVTFAGASIATVPLVILFLVLQKHFIRGMATSGLK